MKYAQDFCCVAALRAATQQTVLNALAKRYKNAMSDDGFVDNDPLIKH
jgi:hypothetical protein